MPDYDYVVVGAGLFGSVFAREMTDRGRRCLVLDRRRHIGGNCHSRRIDGIDVHSFGPHIFNTSSRELWDYVNRFTPFREFRHVVKVSSGGRLYSFPINLQTMREAFGTDSGAEALARMRADRAPYRRYRADNIEAWCLANVGPTLYRLLIEGYTRKQWQRDPRELDAAIVKRLPVRESDDDSYYRSRYQGVPRAGYEALFAGLLAGIEVRLGVDYFDHREHWDALGATLVYSGEIDRFFDYAEGALEWRSLRFERRCFDCRDYQRHAIVNYADAGIPWTRAVEYRHFNPEPAEHTPVTQVVREYPAETADTGEAYYPVATPANHRRYQRYRSRHALLPDTIIGGRLGAYAYVDMAPTIRMALNTVDATLRRAAC